MQKSETIELTAKDVKLLYQFSLDRIAKLVFSSNPGSGTYIRAVRVLKSKDQAKEVINFIRTYNRLSKRRKP